MNDINKPSQSTTTVVNNDDDVFLDDPLLPAVHRNKEDDYFCLGLVANWPNASSTTRTDGSRPRRLSQPYNASNYERFVSAVKTECFRGETDLLFFLPFHALHITIASLFPARLTCEMPRWNTEATIEATAAAAAAATTTNTDGDSSENYSRTMCRSEFLKAWNEILLRASSNKEWPKRPLELELDSAQIRNRAGILLWKEHTGGLEEMRRCIELAANEEFLSSPTAQCFPRSVILEHLRIPNIIHTTFLRYHHCEDRMGRTNQSLGGGDRESHKPLRPSQANSILTQRIIPSQPLFSKMSNTNRNDDDAKNNNPRFESSTKGATRNDKSVAAEFVRFVNCKIYLLSPRKEVDHEVFLELPLVREDSSSTKI